MSKKLLQVLNGVPQSPPPFWFMRQAGRYMPEYRLLRDKAGSFLNLCLNPKYAAEVTLQPIRHFGMDGAILFADILLIPLALGVALKFENREGPKLGAWSMEHGGLKFDEKKVQPIYETLKLLRNFETLKQKTIIGFAGAPWTVATYMVEGGSSKTFTEVKKMALATPENFQRLIDILVDSTAKYLISQVGAGAEVLQLFDSWAGELTPDEFDKWVIKPTAEIVSRVKNACPWVKIIGFPRRSHFMLIEYAEKTGVDAVSVDSSTRLGWCFDNLKCAIQGNLDPIVLLTEKKVIKREAEKILEVSKGKPFIFNLGHGILPQTPVENVEFLCELIKNYRA